VTAVPAGTFHLGRKSGDADYAPGGLTVGSDETPGVTATLSGFRLDVYQVTVGRFRKFVDAVVAGYVPPAGSGKHSHLSGGGLTGETGWDAAWSTTTNLPTSKATWDGTSGLSCNASYQTWTIGAGANETKAINCVSWFQAYALCIWDGGFLPTEAEWELAASGGEERVFPWSAPASSVTIDCSYANYAGCPGNVGVVGAIPKGDGKWGHSDLAGNLYEWALDWYVSPYPTGPCNDCASISIGTYRVLRGGDFNSVASHLRAASRYYFNAPANRNYDRGFRCARMPLHSAPLLVRLMGGARVLIPAIEELRALPQDAVELSIARDPVLRFRASILANPSRPTPEEQEFVMSTQSIVEQIREEGREEGREVGREEGREVGREEGRHAGLAQAVARLYEARFGSMPAALLSRLEAVRADAVLDRLLLVAASGSREDLERALSSS
jgi:formylglycine-generating enzyme